MNKNSKILQTNPSSKNILELVDYPPLDEYFGPNPDQFEFTVDRNYNHKIQLGIFKRKYRGKLFGYSEDISDKNFSKVSHKLKPGEIYLVTIIPVLKRVKSEYCLLFLKKPSPSLQTVFVGAQGVSLLYRSHKSRFPIGKWVLSFDHKENLFKDHEGSYRVPGISRSLQDNYRFLLGQFEHSYDSSNSLLLFQKYI